MKTQSKQWDFIRVETVTHLGKALAVAEAKPAGAKLGAPQFLYSILDMEHTGEEAEQEWLDEKQWTPFRALSFPQQVRCAGMSLLTVHADSLPNASDQRGDWHLVSDNKFLYLFQSQVNPDGKNALLANRFVMVRGQSQREGEPGPLTLELKTEARYARSQMRETPENEKDTQSIQNPDGGFFQEPTLHFSMLNPYQGRFAVCLLPGDESGQSRWQFFEGTSPTTFAAYSFLRDESGWVDLSDKSLNEWGNVTPDQVFCLNHTTGPLSLAGRPKCLLFQRQETSATALGTPTQGLTVPRVMLACRMSDGTEVALVTVDFALKNGLPAIPETVDIGDVAPAKTALNFDEDVVMFPADVPLAEKQMAFTVWARHLGGSGMVVKRGFTDGAPSGFEISWDSANQQLHLRVDLVDGNNQAVPFNLVAPAPTSFVWHHLAFTFRVEENFAEAYLLVDGRPVNYGKVEGHGLRLAANGPLWLAGPPRVPASYSLGTLEGLHFTGDLDEVQLWNTWLEPEALEIYREVKDPESQEHLAGYWQFNDAHEGSETTAKDSSKWQNHGMLMGARWITETAPVESADGDQPGQDLSSGMGVLRFEGYGSFSDPTLLSSADGRIHLYADGKNAAGESRMLVAQYDTKVARSQFALGWTASDQNGSLLLIGRQPGPALNGLKTHVSAQNPSALLNLEVVSPHAEKETWRGLPQRAQRMVAILNGDASSELQDLDVQSGKNSFYDYAGTRPIVALPTETAGDPLLLITSQAGNVPSVLGLHHGSLVLSGDADSLSVHLQAANWGEIERGWNFSLTYPNFDRTLPAAIDQINRPESPSSFSGTLARFPLRGGALYFAGPAELTHITAILENDSQDSSKGQLTLTLHKVDSEETVIWPSLPRTPEAMVKILNGQDCNYAYDDPMKTQAKSFVVMTLNAIHPIANGFSKPLVSGNVFERSVLFSALSNDAAGVLAYGESIAAIRQGLSREMLPGAPEKSSHFFKAFLFDAPTNGVAPRVNPGVAVLHQPGNFGGWIPQPPAVSGYFDAVDGTTIAKRAWDPLASAALLPPGDFTVETWIRCDEAGQGRNPHILTVNSGDSEANGRFTLGLDMVEALQLEEKTSKMGAYTADERLASNKPYSLTFWLKLPAMESQKGSVLQMVQANGQALFNVDVSRSFLTFKLLTPNTDTSLAPGVIVPLKKEWRDTWQLVTCVFDPAESGSHRFTLRVFLADQAFEASITTIRLYSIQILNVGMPHPDWAKFGIPMEGCQCPIASIGIWHRQLKMEDIPAIRTQGGPGSQDLIAYWSFSNIVDGKVPNLVKGGPEWTGTLETPKLTQGPGFHAVLGTGSRVAASLTHPVQGGRWVHLAAVATNTSALEFDGSALAYVAKSEGLAPSKAFSLDAVFTYAGPQPGTPIQYLVAKSDSLAKEASFTLGITQAGLAQFRFWVDAPEGKREFTLASRVTLTAGRSYYLAAGAELRTKGTSPTDLTAELFTQLYLYDLENGQEETLQLESVSWNKDAERIIFTPSRARLVMGCLNDREDPRLGASQRGFFQGTLASVRFWKRLLGADAALLAQSSEVPANMSAPSASWRFSEGKGLVAKDDVGGQDAALVRESMWQPSHLTTKVTFFINGMRSESRSLALAAWDANKAYGDAGMISVGALQRGGIVEATIHGQLDELRFWHGARTEEQLRDHLFTTVDGADIGLKAYWHFSIGSGRFIKDGSGHSHHLEIAESSTNAFWKRSQAPVSNEAPPFLNLLGGVVTAWTPTDGLAPAAFEYSDLQKDATGSMRGVMKRGYAYLYPDKNGRHSCYLVTGFGLGALELRFIGQVQTKPTLIGFVEGAPPVPSENLTRPYYLTPLASAYQAYDGVSAVSLIEAEDTVISYESQHGHTWNLGIAGKGGFAFEHEDEAGMGYIKKLTKIEGKVQIGASVSSEIGIESGENLTIGSSRTHTSEMSAGGDWEDDSNLVNAKVGRRYLPDNVGSALVKSTVADLYALRLAKTDTLIGMQIVADPDMPEDFNIIMFPINPTYTKQGTLDGKIGFVNDPDFANADLERGSYYQPKEAYDLVAQIAAYEADLEADYRNYSPAAAMFQGSPQASATFGVTQPFNFAANVNLRNMVNTYVWTADGGFFAKEHQTMVSRQESLGSSFGFAAEASISGEATMIFGWPGIAFEAEAVAGYNLTRTATKARESGRNFELGAELNVESFLQKYDAQAQKFDGESTPGKVSAYRFNSYYLAPNRAHFQTFFNKVVQQDWLRFSNQPEAVALREAMGQTNLVWRVMHRVTYVSRVPEEFRETPSTTQAPVSRAAIYPESNWQIIQAVAQKLEGKPPTPEAIGDAVSQVFEELRQTVAWWEAFLKQAESDRSSQAYRDYQVLRQSVLAYMLAKFQGTDKPSGTRKFGSPVTRYL